jgi:uncharacterized coiled-coil protein SlyX
MEQVANAISTFLVDAKEYQDLTKRAMRVDLLEDKINIQEKELDALKIKISDQDKIIAGQDANIEILFSLVAKLKTEKDLQPKQQDRSEILLALIQANGGKMLERDARKKMDISKQALSNLIATIPDIETRPLRTDKRFKLLVLK